MLKLILPPFFTFLIFISYSQEDSTKLFNHSVLVGSFYYSELEKTETSILKLQSRFVVDLSYHLNMNLTTKKKYDILIGVGVDLFFYDLIEEDSTIISQGFTLSKGVTPLLIINSSYKTYLKKDLSFIAGVQLKKNIQYFGRSVSIAYGVNIGLEKQFENIFIGLQYFQRIYYSGFSREISGLRLCLGF